jgi:cytoskeletal protein RodZ
MDRRFLLYGVYVLVLVGLIAAIIVAFHSNDNKPEPKQVTTSQQQKQQQQKAAEQKAAQQKAAEQKAAQQKAAEQKAAQEKQKQQQSGQVATNTPGAATQQSNPSYTTTPPSTQGAATQNGKLSNTGPGEAFAAFMLATLTGTILYSIRQRRQLA